MRPGGNAAAAARSRSTGRSAARVATHAAPATTVAANSAPSTAYPAVRRTSAAPPTRSADATAIRGVPSGAIAETASHRRGCAASDSEKRSAVTPCPAASARNWASSSGNGGPPSTGSPAESTTRTPGTAAVPVTSRCAAAVACPRSSWSAASTSAP